MNQRRPRIDHVEYTGSASLTVVFKDRMWIMGGWFDSFSEPPRDVWRSADGARWEQVTGAAPWKHSDLPTTLVFRESAPSASCLARLASLSVIRLEAR